MFKKSRSLQIYMKPGIKEDDLLLKIWDASREADRPQAIFRTMLRAGLIAMLEAGDMPESIIEECGLDGLMERRRHRARKTTQPEATVPTAYPYAQPPAVAYPWPQPATVPAAQPYPIQSPAPHQLAPEAYAAPKPERAEEPLREVSQPPVTREEQPQVNTEQTAADGKSKGTKGKRLGSVMPM